jgi:hypothetical protein
VPGNTQYKLDWERKRRLDPEYRARRNAYQSTWKKANREKLREGDRIRSLIWRTRNPELSKKNSRKYAKAHPEVGRASCAAWHHRRCHSLPKWADLKKINAVYRRAQILTQSTGVEYEVDHVLPLRGRIVCGLHVHNNLQIITKHANRTKSNRYVG